VINAICFGEYNFVQRWKTKMFVANQKQTKENIHLQFSPSERTTLTILIKLIFHHNQVKTIIKKYFSNPTLTVKKTVAYNILSLTEWMRKNVMYGHIENLMLNAFRRIHFETAAQLTLFWNTCTSLTMVLSVTSSFAVFLKPSEKIEIEQNMSLEVQLVLSKRMQCFCSVC